MADCNHTGARLGQGPGLSDGLWSAPMPPPLADAFHTIYWKECGAGPQGPSERHDDLI